MHDIIYRAQNVDFLFWIMLYNIYDLYFKTVFFSWFINLIFNPGNREIIFNVI